MTTSRLLAVLTTVVVGGFVLTGCTSQSTSTPATPTPSATSAAATPSATPSASTPAPTPAPTPTAPAVDPADPASWVMSSTGLGPIVLGGSVSGTADELAAAGGPIVEVDQECPVASVEDDTLPQIYFGRAELDSDEITNVRLGVGPMPAGATSPTTAEGIGIGSTIGEVKAAYPSITQTGEYNSTFYFGLPDAAGNWLVFTTSAAAGAQPDDASIVSTISVGDGPVPPTEYCG